MHRGLNDIGYIYIAIFMRCACAAGQLPLRGRIDIRSSCMQLTRDRSNSSAAIVVQRDLRRDLARVGEYVSADNEALYL